MVSAGGGMARDGCLEKGKEKGRGRGCFCVTRMCWFNDKWDVYTPFSEPFRVGVMA